MRRIFLWAGLVFYAVVMGCVLIPAGGRSSSGATHNVEGNYTSHKALEGLPICSVTIQLQRTDWIDRYEKNIDEIAALGADTVQFVVDPRQENGKSECIYLDMRRTPSFEALSRLINHAKSKGLRVTLMPIVLLDKPTGAEWRGKLHPDTWEDWFDSYRSMIQQYAYVAEGNKVDLLVIGSELVTTENKLEEWTKTINMVRGIYHGKITYSCNWDDYKAVPFWNQLDLIGMNSYWSFGEKDTNPSPSVDHIVDRWHQIQSDLFKFQDTVRKPIVFLEIGWFSHADVAYEPWDYTQDDQPVDLELQRKLYDGFFKVWWGEPRLGGFSVWEWPPDAGGKDDRGYTPRDKPAEKVLRDYLAKLRWEVR